MNIYKTLDILDVDNFDELLEAEMESQDARREFLVNRYELLDECERFEPDRCRSMQNKYEKKLEKLEKITKELRVKIADLEEIRATYSF